MKAKVRLASKAHATAATMAKRCEALAQEAEARVRAATSAEDRQAATEAALAYWKMAADWHATEARAEQISPQRFSAKNAGTQPKTVARLALLEDVAAAIGTRNHEAVAAEALQTRARDVFQLWRVRGDVAHGKIMNFLRNRRF